MTEVLTSKEQEVNIAKSKSGMVLAEMLANPQANTPLYFSKTWQGLRYQY